MTWPMWFLSAVASGWAQTPVVHDSDDPTAVLRRVSARTAVPIEQLEAIHIEDLTSRPPTVAGAGSLRHCAGQPVTANALRSLQLRAEAAWRADQVQEALDHLDLGVTQLGCLRERVDRKTGTRMFLLRAGLLAHTGDPAAALEEACTALALTPEVRWDETLPPEGAAVLKQAREIAEDGTLSVLPRVSTPPWVDGTPMPPSAPVARRPGLHLVQIPATSGLQSAWLTLEGHATVVLPASFRAPVLEGMLTTDPAVLQLFSATVGTRPTYIATPDGLWFVTYSETEPRVEVLEQPMPTVAPVAADPEPKRRRKKQR